MGEWVFETWDQEFEDFSCCGLFLVLVLVPVRVLVLAQFLVLALLEEGLLTECLQRIEKLEEELDNEKAEVPIPFLSLPFPSPHSSHSPPQKKKTKKNNNRGKKLSNGLVTS